jgi:hypothetical protein
VVLPKAQGRGPNTHAEPTRAGLSGQEAAQRSSLPQRPTTVELGCSGRRHATTQLAIGTDESMPNEPCRVKRTRITWGRLLVHTVSNRSAARYPGVVRGSGRPHQQAKSPGWPGRPADSQNARLTLRTDGCVAIATQPAVLSAESTTRCDIRVPMTTPMSDPGATDGIDRLPSSLVAAVVPHHPPAPDNNSPTGHPSRLVAAVYPRTISRTRRPSRPPARAASSLRFTPNDQPHPQT